MTNFEKSELVIAKILALLWEWGIQSTQIKFDELELEEDEFGAFFFPCIEWLQGEGVIRTTKIVRTLDSEASGIVLGPVLTAQGLAVLGKSISIGDKSETLLDGIKKVSSSETSAWQLGDALGGILGGFTKSMGS